MPLDTTLLAVIAFWAFAAMALGSKKQPFSLIGWSALAIVALGFTGGGLGNVVRISGQAIGDFVGGLLNLI